MRRTMGLLGSLAVATACGSGPGADGSGSFAAPEVHVAIGPDGAEVAVGDTVRMRAILVPPRADPTWEWSIAPLDRATIAPDGLVTTHQPGEVMVQACTGTKPRACGSVPMTVK